MKAILILGNFPSHPNIEKLYSRDEKIRCLALPPSMSVLLPNLDYPSSCIA
jgi:hypothetical protein